MKNQFKCIVTILFLALLACNNVEKKVSISDTIIASKEKTNDSLLKHNLKDSIHASQYPSNISSKQTAELVKQKLADLYKEDLQKTLIDSFSKSFVFYEYDLNSDGKKEIFVGLNGSYFCGSGGCTMYLLDYQGKLITKFSVSRDVVIDQASSNGYKNLFIYSGGKYRIATFNGKTYPSNPSTLKALNQLPVDDLPRVFNFSIQPYPKFMF